MTSFFMIRSPSTAGSAVAGLQTTESSAGSKESTRSDDIEGRGGSPVASPPECKSGRALMALPLAMFLTFSRTVRRSLTSSFSSSSRRRPGRPPGQPRSLPCRRRPAGAAAPGRRGSARAPWEPHLWLPAPLGRLRSGLVGLLLLHLLFHLLLLLFGLLLHRLGLGLHLGRLVEGDVNFVDVLDALLGVALERVGRLVVGVPQELPVVVLRLVQRGLLAVLVVLVEEPEIEVAPGARGIELLGGVVLGLRLVNLLVPAQRDAEADGGLEVLRLQLEHRLEVFLRGVVVAVVEREDRQVEARLGQLRDSSPRPS